MWLSGRASPCQGEGRGFESRHPLQETALRGGFCRFRPLFIRSHLVLICQEDGHGKKVQNSVTGSISLTSLRK